MSDKDITSPFNNSTISRRQVMRIKKIYQLEYYRPIQHHILQTNITRIARQTARRITDEHWKMQCFNNFWWFIITITDPICLLGKWCVLFHKISFLLKFFQDPKQEE